MMLKVNMFSVIMMLGILGEIDSAAIVKENDGGVQYDVFKSQFNE